MWYFNEQTLVLEKIASSERAYFSVSKQVGDSDYPYSIRYCGDVEPGESLESFKSKEEAAKQLKNIARNLKAINLGPEQVSISPYTPIISYLTDERSECITVGTSQPTNNTLDIKYVYNGGPDIIYVRPDTSYPL